MAVGQPPCRVDTAGINAIGASRDSLAATCPRIARDQPGRDAAHATAPRGLGPLAPRGTRSVQHGGTTRLRRLVGAERASTGDGVLAGGSPGPPGAGRHRGRCDRSRPAVGRRAAESARVGARDADTSQPGSEHRHHDPPRRHSKGSDLTRPTPPKNPSTTDEEPLDHQMGFVLLVLGARRGTLICSVLTTVVGLSRPDA